MFRKVSFINAALILSVVAVSSPAFARAPDPVKTETSEIKTLGANAGAVAPVPVRIVLGESRDAIPEGVDLQHGTLLKSFYGEQGHGPLWDSGAAAELVNLLEQSWTHGLNPENYRAGVLRQMAQAEGLTTAQKANFELLATDAAIKYARDLSGMRVDAAAVREDAEFWRQPLPAEEILEALSRSPQPARYLESLAPRGNLYNRLRQELIQLMARPANKAEQVRLDFDRTYLFPGDSHPDVGILRARLGVPHDPVSGSDAAAAHVYDDKLAAAIIDFQRRNDLEPDGIIGPDTLSVLNFTREDRINQVIANLERLRWLYQEYPPRYLLVNIPSQRLWAVEGGRAVHEMRVVVGRPSRPTKRFSTDVTGIRFNPKWNVPLSIKMRDFLPKLKESPYALSDKGIEFVRGYGDNAVTLDPGSINWHAVGTADMNNIRMVQSSGNHNALGRIRILMPNRFNIYLHDTNHKGLFQEESRTYSSGCIRMEDPRAIANFVLRDNEGWQGEKIDHYLETTRTVEVAADRKMPVYVIYQTMWLDNGGRLIYGPDVYGKDSELINVLSAANALPATSRYAKVAPNLASAGTIR